MTDADTYPSTFKSKDGFGYAIGLDLPEYGDKPLLR